MDVIAGSVERRARSERFKAGSGWRTHIRSSNGTVGAETDASQLQIMKRIMVRRDGQG